MQGYNEQIPPVSFGLISFSSCPKTALKFLLFKVSPQIWR